MDRLANEETLRLPVEWQWPGQVDAGVAAGRVPNGDRLDDDGAGHLHRHVGIERALHVERIVPAAEQQVEHFDRALDAIGVELAIDELNAAEADATREDRRLAERLRIAAGISRAEIEIIGEPKSRQCRGGRNAVAILLAAVVENVEDVDLLRFRRLRADGKQRSVLL